MRNQLRKTIGGMASIRFQDRWIVHATPDDYILPDDLLEYVSSVVRTALTLSPDRSGLSASEGSALRQLLGEIDAHTDEIPFQDASLSNEYLVQKNPARRALREATA